MVFRKPVQAAANLLTLGALVYVVATPVCCGLAIWLAGPGRVRHVALAALVFWALVIAFLAYQFVGRCCLQGA
jgi:hypothetical protein